MDSSWLIIGICVFLVISGALPLLRDRHSTKLPPPRETLHDWRDEQRR
jgi:hypothetical protein